MKIHYLSPSLIPSRTANSIHVMEMCQAFAESGHEVALYAQSDSSVPEIDIFAHYGVEPSFDIIRCKRPLFRKLPGDFIYASAITREAKKRKLPDLFYGRHLYGVAAAAHLNVPVIYEAHTPPGNRLEGAIQNWLYRRRNFVRLVVISESLRKEYLRIFPLLPPEKIRVAHDGADLLKEKTPPSPPESWPGRPGAFQVGYVGHLYPGKGMEVIAALTHRLPHMDFHVIGGMEKNIVQWQNKGVGKNLRFHGFVAHGNLQWYLGRLDVVLAPYQRKVLGVGGKKDIAPWMSPLKIFEYMAAGKAIVCSDLPVLREILSHETDAWLVPPEDLNLWAQALRTLEQNVELRLALGNAAHRKFTDHYTWEKRARAVLAQE